MYKKIRMINENLYEFYRVDDQEYDNLEGRFRYALIPSQTIELSPILSLYITHLYL